jgi:hypothetical protein
MKTSNWKRIDNDNSQEITLANGRKFKVCKQYDVNMNTQDIKHKGQWQVHEWDTYSKEWEFLDNFSPMWYAKQQAIELGSYDGI